MKKLAYAVLSILLCATTSIAQSDQDYIEVLRSQLQTDKKALIASAMDFQNDQASEKFWGIYRQYEQQLTPLGDERVALLKEFAKNYQAMSNEIADDLVKRSTSLTKKREELLDKTVNQVRKEMSPVVAARFLQVERQIQLVTDAKIAVHLPLIQPERAKSQG